MGTSVAERKLEHDAVPAPKKTALGPSEKGLGRLLSLGTRTGVAPAEQTIVMDALKECATDTALEKLTSGGSLLVEVVNALEEHDHPAALAQLVSAGVDAPEALEVIAKLSKKKLPERLEKLVEHTGPIAGILSNAITLTTWHAKLGLAVIAQEHVGGDRDAAVASYAHAWAKTVTDALYADGISPPAHTGLAYLDDARYRAWHDAVATLRQLDGAGARELAAQLHAQLGTQSNARHVLESTLLEEGGMKGIKLYEGQVVR